MHNLQEIRKIDQVAIFTSHEAEHERYYNCKLTSYTTGSVISLRKTKSNV